MIEADVEDATPVVETGNVPLVWPEATVTEEGTVADVLPLERLTTVPPDAAGPSRVTVPVELFPPTTVDGLRLTPTTDTGFTVRIAV